MRLRYRDEDEEFRSELRAWLGVNMPPRHEMAVAKLSSAHLPEWARAWQLRMYDDGWLVPGWPPELGGRNATPVQQMIYFEELAREQIPRSMNPQGLSIVTPSIVDHGTEEQKERFAVPTLRAEITWCLGMSEPGAGSDLASLSTRADLDGDTFVVNGQKVWTSGAHHADWCLCFVRTDRSAPKHKGISALLIDMKTPGITCRPLPELTGEDYADFNEVFFADVVVPRQNLLGTMNEGWAITQGSLAHERGMLWIGNAHSVQQCVDELVALGREDPRIGHDDRFRDEVARLAIDSQAIMLLGYQGFSKFVRGAASPEHSILKLVTSEVERRSYLAGMEAVGTAGVRTDVLGPSIWREGSWAEQYFRSFAGTIAGGTSEIQRNIIAERILGLPRR
jgi:alkylation response protein AidB-like acyl-CoA dehydrogenase